jgi:hypothetical protein
MIIKNLKTNKLEWVDKPCIIPMQIDDDTDLDTSIEIPLTWGDEDEFNLLDTYSLSYSLESTGKKEKLLGFTGLRLASAVKNTFNAYFEITPAETFTELEPYFYVKKTIQPYVTAYAYYLLDKKLFKEQQKNSPQQKQIYKKVIQSFKNTRKGRKSKETLEGLMMTYFYILNGNNYSNLEIEDTINSTSTVNEEFARMMVETIDENKKRQLMTINKWSNDKDMFDSILKEGTLMYKEVA